MKPRQFARHLTLLVVVASLAAGCGKGSLTTGTQATAVNPNATPAALQEAIHAASPLPAPAPGDMQALNQAEHGTLELLREQSGARAALGGQADAIFLELDQAKDAMVHKLVGQTGAGTGYTPTPAQMRLMAGLFKTMGVSVLASMNYQQETLGAAMFVLATTPFLVAKAGRDANGNAHLAPQEMT